MLNVRPQRSSLVPRTREGYYHFTGGIEVNQTSYLKPARFQLSNRQPSNVV